MTGIGLMLGSGMPELAGTAPAATGTTPYGRPSAAPREVQLGGKPVIALPRHGDGHSIPPHRINYRANIQSLYDAGCRTLICLNTVGVVVAGVVPGSLAVPDQVIDYTWGREHTFFDGSDGDVRHIEFTTPFDAALRSALLDAGRAAGVPCRDGGVYGATQGPRLESAAEVDRLERDGVTYVGMTGMPEFCLAQERGFAVASLCLVVNLAAGRGGASIHADIGRSMQIAKTRTIKVLEAFLQSLSV